MASRMERLYQNDEDKKRTSRNRDLYDEIYDSKYNQTVDDVNNINVDTIADLDVGKQIDIREVKALLEKRDEYKKSRQLVKDSPTIKKENIYYEPSDDTVHDINDMIKQAKGDYKESVRPRSLAETQVLTLQELINQKDYGNKSKLDKDDVKDLINTIYNTNMLKNDDGMGLLDDLKSSGNTVVNPDIKKILDEKKAEMEEDKKEEDYDKSFYTSSLGFKKSDFSSNDEDEDLEKSNKGTAIFLIILGLLFIIAASYIIIKYVL